MTLELPSAVCRDMLLLSAPRGEGAAVGTESSAARIGAAAAKADAVTRPAVTPTAAAIADTATVNAAASSTHSDSGGTSKCDSTALPMDATHTAALELTTVSPPSATVSPPPPSSSLANPRKAGGERDYSDAPRMAIWEALGGSARSFVPFGSTPRYAVYLTPIERLVLASVTTLHATGSSVRHAKPSAPSGGGALSPTPRRSVVVGFLAVAAMAAGVIAHVLAAGVAVLKLAGVVPDDDAQWLHVAVLAIIAVGVALLSIVATSYANRGYPFVVRAPWHTHTRAHTHTPCHNRARAQAHTRSRPPCNAFHQVQ